MKIVIAAWHLRDFNVGLGRYARGLIEAIGRVDADNRYEILLPDDSYRFPDRPNVRYRLIRFPIFKRRFWEQVAPLLVGQYDLLHFPYDSAIAWKRGKFVVTIHDLKPVLFGTGRPRWNVNRMVEQALIGDRWARVDHVLTDSRCSRRDIQERLGLSADRVTVVYPGVELERFRPRGNGATCPEPRTLNPERRTLNLEPRTSGGDRLYVLCVAGPDPTKNVQTLVEAFARLPLATRGSHDLILAGDFRRRADLRKLAGHLGVDKQVLFPGVVSDERLIELYQHATVLVFPSRYEGFGLPVLEAMACGCPVICSNASSLPEVAGDAAILLDPGDVEGFAKAIARVLEDAGLRRDLRERGLARAATFSWDRTARETIAVYEKVAGGRGVTG